jgi:hypothetical protein
MVLINNCIYCKQKWYWKNVFTIDVIILLLAAYINNINYTNTRMRTIEAQVFTDPQKEDQ